MGSNKYVKKMRINLNYILGFFSILLIQSQVYAVENNDILSDKYINQQEDKKNVLDVQNINNNVKEIINKLKPEKTVIKHLTVPQYDTFAGDVIFDDGYRCEYPVCRFYNYNIKCIGESNIKIGKWNNLIFKNSNIQINTDKIKCIGYVNTKLLNTKLTINNNYENTIDLLCEGTNKIVLNNSELIFNNKEDNNVITLFNSENSLPIITLINSRITLNNIDLKLNSGKINLREKSNFICNNSKITFGVEGRFNINDSNCTFNNTLIELNSGRIKLDGNNSKFDMVNSQILSKHTKCIFEVLPNNKILLNNSLVNCLGKFKKIEIEESPQEEEQNEELQNTSLIDLKNNSIFSWRKMRCTQQDLNSIDETSAVILQEYFD